MSQENGRILPVSPAAWKPTLAAGAVAVVTVHCDEVPPLPAAALAQLAPAELTRAGHYRQDSDRHRFQVRRWLLRRLLADWLECEPGALVFETDAAGKPGLVSAGPGLPAPLQFSLSCSHGLAACAFSRNRRLGLDIEKEDDRVEALALADRYFTPVEARAIRAAASPAAGTTLFFQYWTRKEAYLKAAGIRPLDSFEVVGTATRTPVDFGQPENNSRWQIVSLALRAGFQAALVAENRLDSVPSIIHYPLMYQARNNPHWPFVCQAPSDGVSLSVP